jgi:hypothetical protein
MREIGLLNGFQRFNHTFMVKQSEGVLHATCKRQSEMMLIHPVIMHGWVVFFAKLQTIILKVIDAFYNQIE